MKSNPGTQQNRSDRYARVTVHVPRVAGSFDYRIPAELNDQVKIGCLVEVPFGSQWVQGIVVGLPDKPDIPEVKPILSLVDPFPVVTVQQIALAGWLEQNTLATFSQCLYQMVLPGLKQFADTRYKTTGRQADANLSESEIKILDAVQHPGQMRGRQLDRLFPQKNWQETARGLVRMGYLTSESFLPRPGLHPRYIKRIQLTVPVEAVDLHSPPVASRSILRRQARTELMNFLVQHPEPMDLQWVRARVSVEITHADLAALSDAEYIQVWETEFFRDPLQRIDVEEYNRHELTPAQQQAWDQISIAMNTSSPEPILLYGITGSGKTELYLRAAENALASGQQVIWLVPEISLTPQTIGRLMHRFPGQVGLIHSRLTEGERYDTWQRTRSGKIQIITGPRSALFTPLRNPGLIIVDECHDSSYYQGEDSPSYASVDAAIAYAKICGAVCILGTATPDVAMYQRFLQRRWPILQLPERTIETPGNKTGLPPVQIVDMRAELKRGNRSIFSTALTESLVETYRAGNQSILFLNRRGSATHVFCRECGYVVKCPHCSLPLSAHGEKSQLLCHTCGYTRRIPRECPECHSRSIRQIGIGTETVEKAVHELLPRARVLRWDADSRRDQKLTEIVLTHFRNHQYDILVGTQMVSKGLDFPLVQLVGMILADIGLNLPDYRAPERTFQVLTQVAGRAGRSGTEGKVVLQTYQPEHYAIQAASRHDFPLFFQQELAYRKSLGYPPFLRIIRIEDRDRDEYAPRDRLAVLAQEIHGWFRQEGKPPAEMLGPLPCFFTRQYDQYRWQLVMRIHDSLEVLHRHLDRLSAFHVEVDPPNLL